MCVCVCVMFAVHSSLNCVLLCMCRHVRGPITCQLCNVKMLTSQLLAVHLETERHQRREQKVFNHYTDKWPVNNRISWSILCVSALSWWKALSILTCQCCKQVFNHYTDEWLVKDADKWPGKDTVCQSFLPGQHHEVAGLVGQNCDKNAAWKPWRCQFQTEFQKRSSHKTAHFCVRVLPSSLKKQQENGYSWTGTMIKLSTCKINKNIPQTNNI